MKISNIISNCNILLFALMIFAAGACTNNQSTQPETIPDASGIRSVQKNVEKQLTVVTQEYFHKNKKMKVYSILLFSEKKNSETADAEGEVSGFLIYGKKSKFDASYNNFAAKISENNDLTLEQVQQEIYNAATEGNSGFIVEALDENNIKTIMGINGLYDYNNKHGFKLEDGNSTVFAGITEVANTTVGTMNMTDKNGKSTTIIENFTKGNLLSLAENNQGLNLIINFSTPFDNTNGTLLNYTVYENKSIANWINNVALQSENTSDETENRKALFGMNLVNGVFNAQFKHLKNGFEIAENGEQSIYRVIFSSQRLLTLNAALNGYYFNTLTQNNQHMSRLQFQDVSDVASVQKKIVNNSVSWK